MANDICLHPDLIDEVMEDLFAVNVISQQELKKLKNDFTPTDPNIMMDVRHKEVKKESLIDLEPKGKDFITMRKMKVESTSKEPCKKVKDLSTIDREILNTRKCLEEFQNKMEKKSECLSNLILDLEKKKEAIHFDDNYEDEDRNSPEIVMLNEQETVHYFNLHLDRLENSMNKNPQNNNTKTWRPIEAKSPVINVITTLKDFEERPSLQDIEEEIKLSSSYDLKPFQIAGKSLGHSSEIQTKQFSSTVPNNSPTFSVSVTLDEKNKIISKQYKMTQKVVKTWKLYVKKKKIQKWSDKNLSKQKINLLKKYVSLWRSLTKQVKGIENTHLSKASDTLEIVPAKCCNSQKTLGVGNFQQKAESDASQEPNQTNINQVKSRSSAIKKNRVEVTLNKVLVPSKGSRGTFPGKNLQQNPSDKTEMVHVKTLTPQDVGLTNETNQIASQVCKKHVAKQTSEVKDSMTSRSIGEPLLHRFEAQEKIIKQQRELIEKQNRIIFDLKAKCLEIESKLNWTLAERQLAEAEMQVTKGSACTKTLGRRLESKRSNSIAHEEYQIKNQDKSDVIVKNMLERQAYCSKLAEQTKLRKKRIEEEKEKAKIEVEEKIKQEKEEERRKKVLQMKMEQEIAQEKERNAMALKKIEAELVEKANKHYRNKLLCRSFNKLKSLSLDISVRSEECDKIYSLKITCKMFNIWREKVKHQIQSKYEFADRYYKERLLRTAWDRLCQIHQDYKRRRQVSEDLYNLKLQERMFRRWQSFAAEQFLQNCCKIELAERLHRRQLLRYYFHLWKELPRLMFKEREKEQRRQLWRQSVQQLIPDFTPAYVDEI